MQQYSGPRKVGRVKDLRAMGVDWEEAKSVAGDRREWRDPSLPSVPVGTGGPKSKYV